VRKYGPILHLAGPDAVLATIVRDMLGAAGERATQCTGRAAGMIARRWGLTTSVVTPLNRQVSAALVTIMLEVCCDVPPPPAVYVLSVTVRMVRTSAVNGGREHCATSLVGGVTRS
jgi:hypothetical protein